MLLWLWVKIHVHALALAIYRLLRSHWGHQGILVLLLHYWMPIHVIWIHISFVRNKMPLTLILYWRWGRLLNIAILYVVDSRILISTLLLLHITWEVSEGRLHHERLLILLILLDLLNSLILSLNSRIICILKLSLVMLSEMLPVLVRK